MHQVLTARATCDYCGLPLASTAARASPAAGNAEPQYCCYGCRFAAGVTAASGDSAQARWLLTRLGLAVFFTMNVMVFTLVLWSQDEAAREAASHAFHEVARYLCLLFATPVLLMLAGPLIEDAWRELRALRPSLNLLLAAGVVAAYGYSLASTVRGSGHVYFEVSSMVLVFVTLGRWFEASGKLHTTAALRQLESLLPEQIRVVEGDTVRLVRRELVEPGQCVRVLAGERIPVDGQVERNRSSVDQQVVSGESLPVVKEPGDEVYAGSLNLDGDLWIRATSRADSGLVARLIASVTQASLDREPYQRLAARISRRFVPLVALIALATLAGHAWWSGWESAVLASLSVVVIACPCALGLATPLALWAALGRAAQARILIQEGDALSRLAAANTIFFDKTGTLTTGAARLREFRVAPDTPSSTARRAALALADCSTHPLARALVVGLRAGDPTAAPSSRVEADEPWAVELFETLPGRGLCGRSRELNQQVWLGSRRMLVEHHQFAGPLAAECGDESGDGTTTTCYLAWGGQVRGVATFDEQVRPEASATLAWFQRAGWHTEVLTGDSRARGERLRDLWHTSVRSELLPDDKLAVIRTARDARRRVVMVGDGLNDAPALAAADVGVALASGVDVSRYTAAVCLLADDLRQLPWLVGLAGQTESTVRWNLVWAFGYNSLGIAVAAAGWLNPILAAIAMVVSSVLVVSNSLRLGRGPLLDMSGTASATPSVSPPSATASHAAGETSALVETSR